jgi:hypothetical protein
LPITAGAELDGAGALVAGADLGGVVEIGALGDAFAAAGLPVPHAAVSDAASASKAPTARERFIASHPATAALD